MNSSLFNNISQNISNTTSKLTDNLKSVTSNVMDKTDNITSNINNKISNTSNSFKSNVDNIKEKVVDKIPYAAYTNFNNTSEFINSNNFIAKIIFLVIIILLFIILFKFGVNIITLFLKPNSSPYLYKNMKDAKQLLIIPQDPNAKGSIPILRSKNEYNGIEFSYSTWIYIDDPTYRSDQQYKHIFHKGNDYTGSDNIFYPNNSPGLYLFSGKKGHIENVNKLDSYDYEYPVMGLLVRQNIFTNESSGDKQFYEDINIEGIPIKKWVNIIVRVNNQNIIDVFINGKLMKRKKLSGVVKQNYDNIYINMNGGFSGYLSSLRYFNKSLGTFEISSIVSEGPSLKIDSTNMEGAKPTYLSSKWFFSSSNPTYN